MRHDFLKQIVMTQFNNKKKLSDFVVNNLANSIFLQINLAIGAAKNLLGMVKANLCC